MSAKVSQIGGDDSSFGWSLVQDGFTLNSNNRPVFKCNSSGIEIDGKMTARSGFIGNGSNGFTITNTSIYNRMSSRDDESVASGVYIGTDGIAVAGGKFKVTDNGYLFAKQGYIGNSNSGFTIGNRSISNGMTAVDDTENNGIYVGTDGIALGQGKFVVTRNGALTAKSGEIAGWTISNKMLSKIEYNSSGGIQSNVGMSTASSIAFYAGQNETPSKCAFCVSKDGRVYLTKLFVRVPDVNAPGYNEDDPNTWDWINSEVDIGAEGFKIGHEYATVKSCSGGSVRLSNGQSFKTAASVDARGSWSGSTLTVRPQYNNGGTWANAGGNAYSATFSGGWGQYNPSSSGNPYNKFSVSASEGGTSKSIGVETVINIGSNSASSSPALEYDSSTHKYTASVYGSGRSGALISATSGTEAYADGRTTGQSEGKGMVTLTDPVWASTVSTTRSDNTVSVSTVGRPTTITKSAKIYLGTGSWKSGQREVYVRKDNSSGTLLCRTYVTLGTWSYGGLSGRGSSQPSSDKKYTVGPGNKYYTFTVSVGDTSKTICIEYA